MSAKELKALQKRIQVLEDIEAIKKLKADYAAVCDDKYNPEKGIKLFTQDGIWNGGKDFGVHKGRKEIKKFFQGVAKNIVFAVHFFQKAAYCTANIQKQSLSPNIISNQLRLDPCMIRC